MVKLGQTHYDFADVRYTFMSALLKHGGVNIHEIF